jgi:hypothetical protein
MEKSMPKGPCLPSEFVPTNFSTAADKADFDDAFLHFIESGWREILFTKRFYKRLSNTFDHIAHYVDRHEFFALVFDESETLELLRRSMDRSIADQYWERMLHSKPYPNDVPQGGQ